MSITYHSHTADIRMLIESKTLKGLFVEGVKGMGNILKESLCEKSNEFNKKIIVELQASDHTNLLIDFLSDVLTNGYVEKRVFCHTKIIEFSKYKIKAELFGTSIDKFDEEIKAVTYHESNVLKNKKGFWETNIIFDI